MLIGIVGKMGSGKDYITNNYILPKSWNWLAMEYEEKKDLDLIHYTLGTPCFKEYSNKSLAEFWKKSYKNLLTGMNEE